MIHAVSIGDDAEGHLVPSGDEDTPLLYQGQPVRSRRTDEPLEAIAQQTDGAMVKARPGLGRSGRSIATGSPRWLVSSAGAETSNAPSSSRCSWPRRLRVHTVTELLAAGADPAAPGGGS
ncbi:MAG: hypothetical protein U0790_21115 [Isosphaeraceae bacterium]